MSKGYAGPSKLKVPNYDHFRELRKLIEDSAGVSLEVEIDEDLRRSLRAQQIDDDLLDVTIIQQSDSPREETVSLSANEVSDFIEMVNQKNQEGETTVYTAPYTFNNIKQKLPCTNDSCEEKPGTPCLCQHCGMVGVLVESQKRPAIPHAPNPKFSGTAKHPEKRKNISTHRTRSKSETNLALLKELSDKINSLEYRLHEHEETTVRKDYFKFVIHKLLNQYSNKINELKQAQLRPSVNMSTQYSKTTNRPYSKERSLEPERDFDVHRNRQQIREKFHEKFHETRGGKRDGEKPKFRKEHHNDVLRLPPNMDDIEYNRNVYATSTEQNPFRVKPKRDVEEVSSDTIKKLCDLVYNRCANEKTDKKPPQKRHCDIPEKLLNSRNKAAEVAKQPKGKKTVEDKVDVAYVNPLATRGWGEESSEETECQRKTAGFGGGKKSAKHTIQEKIKYLKSLARRKNVDETELWNNILVQAKKHIKSNEDTVSIQLPVGVKNEEMSELELTLSNLKEIAKKTRSPKKNRSCLSIELNYKTSSDYIPKRGERRR